jgi:hypothetical protein
MLRPTSNPLCQANHGFYLLPMELLPGLAWNLGAN